jgi:hypothetical protein
MGLGAGFTGIGMVGSCTTTAGKLMGVRRSACDHCKYLGWRMLPEGSVAAGSLHPLSASVSHLLLSGFSCRTVQVNLSFPLAAIA